MPITNTMKNAKKSFNVFLHTTLLHKILYFLGFIIALSLMVNYGRQQVEGFEEKTNAFTMHTHKIPEIYDDFYSTVYDELVFNKNN